MIWLALALAVVGLAAVAAAWDTARRVLSAQAPRQHAAELSALEDRIAAAESEAREAMARVRKAGLAESLGRRG